MHTPRERSRISPRTLFAGLACCLSNTTIAQPIDDAVRTAINAGDWPGVVTTISPLLKGEATGDCAYWLGVAHGESDNVREATTRLGGLWDAAPSDPTRTLAVLKYASINWLRNHGNEVFTAAMIHPDVCEALVMARVRIIRRAMESEGSTAGTIAYFAAKEAVRAYDQLLEMGGAPSSEITRWAGFAALKADQFARAAALLSTAIPALPQSWDIRLDYALALLHSGRADEGKVQFTLARDLAPSASNNGRDGPSRRIACNIAWGQACQKLGRQRDAIDAYKQLIAERPDFSGARHMLGQAAYDAGDLGLAIWAFTDSDALDGLPQSPMMLGRCWYDLGEFALAKACFDKAEASYTGQEEPTPAELDHFAGRAMWGLQPSDEALAKLDSASKKQPTNLLFARWGYQASIAHDDPYVAIDICKRLGLAGEPDLAIEGLDEILRRWPTARMKDFAAKRPVNHVRAAAYAMAEICWAEGRVREAAERLKSTRSIVGAGAYANAPWILLLAGDLASAETSARAITLIFAKDEFWSDYIRLAHAVTKMRQDKWTDANDLLKPVKHKDMIRRRDVATYYTWLNAQPANTTAKPPSGIVADPYTALGLIDYRLRGLGNGIEILTLLPGSPLESADIQVMPRDRLWKIEGFGYLGTEDTIARFRKWKLPDKPVEFSILRGDDMMRGTIDLSKAAARLSAKGDNP